jgi:uncharacterized membrane protein
MHRALLSVVLSLSLLLSAVATTYAASYTFTTFDVPGATNTYVYGINSAGQIVGTFLVGRFPDTLHGFLTDGATFITMDVPGARFTEAHGINLAGEIVGTFLDAKGAHGFVATPERRTRSRP